MNKYIDHTLLKANATEQEIVQLCEEATLHQFFAVCVNGCHVRLCVEILKNHPIGIASVVGFPLGANSTFSKLQETEKALKDGATEIDMVINLAWLKAGKQKDFIQEISQLKKLMGTLKLKAILEMCYLNEEEKKIACEWALAGSADFLKTSTGFGTGGATLDDVKLMKKIAKNSAEIKASGGIKNVEQAQAFIAAGATRLGTSSGIAIVAGLEGKAGY